MNTEQDRLIEAQLKKAIPKAFKQLIKAINNGPALVIEPEADTPDESDLVLDDIRAWLFKRRRDNGDTNN